MKTQMNASKAGLVMALMILSGPMARAGVHVFRLDPDRTTIRFAVGATMHTVEGSALLKSGEILFDPASGEVSGRVVVDARSATTDRPGRDAKMHEDVLESGTYPEIVFLPRRLEGHFIPDGESDLKLSGVLEIHGAAHEVTWSAGVKVAGDRLAGKAVFNVPYVEWGMKDPSVFMFRVRKEVEVTLEFAGSLVLPAEKPAR